MTFGIKTRAIGIEQQGRHHARIERRLTKPAFVARHDLRQIQVLARQSDDELRQMVRRHIIDDRRRQELCLQLSKDENVCSCLKGNQIRPENATITRTRS
jgi:hypothetical protein